MAYETVGEGASEYFVEDRDTVHCKHGRFIGYPGGADFMCPYCEDGADVLIEVGRWDVVVHYKDEWFLEGEHLGSCFSLQALQDRFASLFELPKVDYMWFEVKYDTYSTWARSDENA